MMAHQRDRPLQKKPPDKPSEEIAAQQLQLEHIYAYSGPINNILPESQITFSDELLSKIASSAQSIWEAWETTIEILTPTVRCLLLLVPLNDS